MSSKNLLAEIEFEITSTKKLLDRIPEDKLTWKPHERAMTLAELGYHVASIPGTYTIYVDEGKTEVDVLVKHYIPTTKKEIIERFPQSLETATSILGKATDAWDAKDWHLTKNGQNIFTLSRAVFCRILVMNHWYHHRGELVTYLRALGVLIPSVYGPSADEDPFA